MKIKKSLFNFWILLIFFSWKALASDLAFSRNARTFEAQHSSLIEKTLASSCLGLTEMPDGIPCNPAMTQKATRGKLKAQALVSNGYSNIAKSRRLLKGDIDDSLLNELFSEQRVLQAEMFADVMFTSKLLNSKYSPASYKFFSVIRNDAYPDVELFAVEEQNLTLQSGYSFGNFDLGVEVLQNKWKFIRTRFKLLAVSTQQGLEKLKPKEQNATFVQPALTYNFPMAWQPRVSMKVVNLGTVDQDYNEFRHPSETQFGFALSPEIFYGKIDVMMDYKSLNYEESDWEKVHFGLLYRFGSMNLGFGFDNNGSSVGIFYGLEQINAGILFSTTKNLWKDDDYFAQTVYVQIGWQL